MTKWTQFTKRTEDPKLAWLECQLLLRGIPSRRPGYSFHAPILEVPEEYESAADDLLRERYPGSRKSVDDIEDDHPAFAAMDGCPADIAERLRVGGRRFEQAHMERLARRLAPKAPKLARQIRKVARKGPR